MAQNNVGIQFSVDTKQLEKLLNNFNNVRKLLRRIKLDPSLQKTLTGNLGTFKGKITEEKLLKHFGKFANPELAMASSNRLLSRVGNVITAPDFKKLQQPEKEMLLRSKFPTKTYGGATETIQLLKQQKTLKDLTKQTKQLNKETKKYADSLKKIAKIDTSKEKENFISAKKGMFDMDKLMNNFLGKVKTLGMYLSVISLFNFMKDLVSVRKEFETTAIMISKTISKFSKGQNLTAQESFTRAKNLMKELRDYANYIGIEYGEIEKGFARIANAIPEGSLSLGETMGSYKELLKLFAVTGANSEDQTNAIRALFQMIEKGTIAAEEFNRQLGNTPLRAVLFKYGLQAFNKEADNTLKTFEDLQNYLKRTGQDSTMFFKKVLAEAKMDPNNSIFLYSKGIQANLNRLNNAMKDFKLALTGGYGNINPALTSFSSLIQAFTSLIRLANLLIPLLMMLGTAFTVIKTFAFSAQKNLLNFNVTVANMQELFKSGDTNAAMLARNQFLRASFTQLAASIFSVAYAYGNLMDIMSNAKEEGWNWTRVFFTILNSLILIKGVLESFQLLQTIGLFNNLTSVNALQKGASGVASSAGSSLLMAGGKKALQTSGRLLKITIKKASIKSALAKSASSAVGGAAGKIAGGFFSMAMIKGLFASLLPLLPYILAIIVTAVVGYALFKKLFSNKEKETGNGTIDRLERDALIIQSTSIQSNSYAQVDVRADFPVQSQKIDSDNLTVSVFGNSLMPASNL